MLLVVYGIVALAATAIILAYAAQGAPLPPRPVYPAPMEQVATLAPSEPIVGPIWCERTRRFRDPVSGRFVKQPQLA